MTWTDYPPITWPPECHPTPAQRAAWIHAMDQEQLTRWCDRVDDWLETGYRCFIQDHVGRIDYLGRQLADLIDQGGVTVRVAPGVTLHGDTGAFTATADAPPAAVARLLRDLADDLDRQETR